MADFVFPVRVYYEDTDCGGVVYHANYLRFMERARSEYLLKLGYGREALERERIGFIVSSIKIDFLHPIKLLDLLLVETTLTKMGRVSLCYEQNIVDASRKVRHSQATIKLGCVNNVHRPVLIPELLREGLVQCINQPP